MHNPKTVAEFKDAELLRRLFHWREDWSDQAFFSLDTVKMKQEGKNANAKALQLVKEHPSGLLIRLHHGWSSVLSHNKMRRSLIDNALAALINFFRLF